MRIVHVLGTRPNFVKMAPLIAAIARRSPDWEQTIVHTGQHYDRLMSEIFFEQLGGTGPRLHALLGRFRLRPPGRQPG